MSGRRRRRSGSGDDDGRGGIARKAGIAAAWILGAFLAANLAVAMFRTDESGRPKSLVSEALVAAAAFWVPVAVFAGAAIAGTWFSWRSWQRSERPATLWMMRGFIVSLVLVVAVTIAAFSLGRRWFTVAAAAAFAVQTSVFLVAATRDQRRSSGGDSRGRPAADPYAARAAQSMSPAASGGAPAPSQSQEGAAPPRPESRS